MKDTFDMLRHLHKIRFFMASGDISSCAQPALQSLAAQTDWFELSNYPFFALKIANNISTQKKKTNWKQYKLKSTKQMKQIERLFVSLSLKLA